VVAVIVAVLGFIPVVGGALAAVVGVVLTGNLLARELMARAFDARGLDDGRRAQIVAAGRWRVLGFGIATQLCFLVPLGAVVTMPAAVAGATMLSRELIDRRGAGEWHRQ
jgi:CysZ protein